MTVLKTVVQGLEDHENPTDQNFADFIHEFHDRRCQ
jgi:hypothetical protein